MNFLLAALWISLEIACFGCGRQPAEELNAKTSVPSTPGEVVISPAEQSAQRIEIQAVQMRDLPAVLSLPGRIALPDNATWRVGVSDGGPRRKGNANLETMSTRGKSWQETSMMCMMSRGLPDCGRR